MAVSLEILEILIKSEFPPSSYFRFAGITRSQLLGLSFDDLESQLRSLIPPNSTQSSLIARFIYNLFSHQEGQHSKQPSIPIPINQEVKQEGDTTPTSPLQPLCDEDTGNNTQPESTSTPEEQESSLVILNHSFEEQETESDSASQEQISTVDDSRDHDVSDTEESEIPLETQHESETAKSDSDSDVIIVDENITYPPTRIIQQKKKCFRFTKKRKIEIIGNQDAGESTSVSSNSPTIKNEKQKSFQLGRTASECNSHIRIEWAMSDFRRLTSPPQSSDVENLSIVSNCIVDNPQSCSSSNPRNNVSLPNLSILKIRHCIKDWEGAFLSTSSHDVNYSTQLSLILAGSSALDRIEICYENETCLQTLLRVLSSQTLPSLSVLIIRHRDEEEMVTLLASDLTALGRITAPNLKELQLPCSRGSENRRVLFPK